MAARCKPMAATGQSTVSMRFVRALLEVLEQAGVPRLELLRAARMEVEQLEATDGRLPRSELHRIFEIAMDLTGDPALGLRCGETMGAGAFGPISPLVTHSTSLGHAFDSLSRFWRLLSDDPSFEIALQGDRVTIRCLRFADESPRVRTFSSEMRLTNYFRLVRVFCPHARPERVALEYAAPPHAREYARIFENTERFEQPFTGIVLDRALMDAPSPHKDEELLEAMQTLAERRISRLGKHMPYALRVRDVLVQRGSSRRVDMETVARALGISVRSLRRRLADEHTSYQEVESDALAIVAKHLLRDEQRTIQETAFEMGFSDATTFHRAFKRWTGTTPSAFRAGT